MGHYPPTFNHEGVVSKNFQTGIPKDPVYRWFSTLVNDSTSLRQSDIVDYRAAYFAVKKLEGKKTITTPHSIKARKA